MSDQKYVPMPAPPNDSPFHALARALDTRLRADAPDTFAGIVRGADGAVEVLVTLSPPTLVAIVEEVHASTGRRIAVRVVAGLKNNLASLESLFARIREGYQEIVDRGIPLVSVGVHIPANRVRLGVEGLTPELAESLRREFGADQVEVNEGGRYQPT
ncbi:MAG: hypothetical protein AUH39_03580 [Chloroflexi bacterium 13_1_40CM_67_9]|nr:MAG: hypothetical protein AUH39_03580 [Chloroflexi bacterium 13_1_40CM_67_9]